MNKNVVVFRTKLLPFSETFIKEQVLSYKEWNPVLVGQFHIENGLDINECDFVTFEEKISIFSNFKRNFYKLISFSPSRDEKLLRALEPDIIHIHFGVDAVINWSLFRRFDLPILITLHGYDINIKKAWWKSGKEGLHLKDYPERILKIAQSKNVTFIAVSQELKKKAIEFGIPADKIFVSYIGVDTVVFAKQNVPYDSRKQILFVGRLVEKKGCGVLIEAFSKIHDKYPDVELKIIGTGPLEKQLKALAASLNVKVNFVGACNKHQVIEELSKSLVLCLPSVHAESGDAEGFGLVLLEASACGVPVITSAFGGAKEGIINGVTGFAFEENDNNELSYRLTQLISDHRMAEKMGNDARKFVEEKFGIDACTVSLEEIYNKLTNSPSR
ncbi:glycosyltransferase involved in cell wall biosynthesis [Rahnella sp. BIGb0236]|uniref:glycosyltransferase n=1 Tax=Rahnella sp. BIGb0236 TaxID=2485117 RepID=UPI00105FB34A|nr:glycosyltransferase [Rahnella sp. BIGb0236]TDS88338.1 glycosyltransferase involved in cell wall biosynthesis [Rahnella sp. BIGb0236]VTQ62310.1 glycosyl transferase group 1 [Campylobacter jejuni]